MAALTLASVALRPDYRGLPGTCASCGCGYGEGRARLAFALAPACAGHTSSNPVPCPFRFCFTWLVRLPLGMFLDQMQCPGTMGSVHSYRRA